MKNRILMFLIFTAVISCKNDSKSDKKEADTTVDETTSISKNSDGLTLLKGEFVYHDGAAVLQTATEIYGVLLTNKFKTLDKKANAVKTEPTDMVYVEVQGRVTTEKHETILWEKKVEIIEIITVKPNTQAKNNIVKLGS